MASDQNFVDFVITQIKSTGVITAKKMFGEYGIYCDDKIVALFCDDQLFVKPTISGKAFIGEYTKFCPYPGAKPYLLISGEYWDDSEWLTELIKISAAELPPPKPKR